MEKGESGEDRLEKAFEFLEDKSPRQIKQYFGKMREEGDGDSHPELLSGDAKKIGVAGGLEAEGVDPEEEEEEWGQGDEGEYEEEEGGDQGDEGGDQGDEGEDQGDKGEDEEDKDEVLEPEHPLLVKFQIALKEHLQKQIEHLNNEIFEYETGSKKKNSDREALGVQTYETQQSVTKQHEEIDNFVEELETITEAKEEMEYRLHECLRKHKEEKEMEFQSEKKEIELRKEVESVHLLLQQMLDWETDIENDLKTSQRVFEKTRKDKLRLATEKRELDVLLYKLMTEIWKLEGELETILMQLRVKEEEREKLAVNLAMSNTDIEAAQAEHRCLIRGWHSVVIAIGARDKHYNQIHQELATHNEKLRSTISETQQVKKLCHTEMNKNESLTLFKSRVEDDINVCRRQLETEDAKRVTLEKKIMKMEAIVEQTEKDLHRVTLENHMQSREIKAIFHEEQRHTAKKMQLEEAIMAALQDQITNDKASKYLSKTLREVKGKNRALEITLSSTENKNAKVIMDMEAQKRINTELSAQLKEMTTEQNNIEAKLNSIVEESERVHTLTKKREREVHITNKKLEQLIEKIGDIERSPHELKISALEQHIVIVQDKNKELQKFWLREQGHVVCLSEQRQQQIHDSNILRKQTMILEQRNLKINDELDLYKKQENNMTRSINKLQNQLLHYTEQLGKRKNSKQFLDESNDVLQTDFTFRLKNLEIDVIKLESDIQDMQNDMQQLTEELLDKNREALEWEKHWKLLVETKKNMNEAKSEGGEIGKMQSEIHRMRVRYGQLKKAQEKLIQDLDHCISRRDAIVTNAEAREKRIKGTQSSLIFNRKLDDARNKLKQMQDDIEALELQVEHVEEETRRTENQIISSRCDIDQIADNILGMQQKIEEEKTEKQMKLDLLVLNQRKLKIYVELSKGRMPYLTYKTEERITEEYTKQKDLNDRLQRVMETFLNQMPEHGQLFQRALNTLKLSTVI